MRHHVTDPSSPTHSDLVITYSLPALLAHRHARTWFRSLPSSTKLAWPCQRASFCRRSKDSWEKQPPFLPLLPLPLPLPRSLPLVCCWIAFAFAPASSSSSHSTSSFSSASGCSAAGCWAPLGLTLVVLASSSSVDSSPLSGEGSAANSCWSGTKVSSSGSLSEAC